MVSVNENSYLSYLLYNSFYFVQSNPLKYLLSIFVELYDNNSIETF